MGEDNIQLIRNLILNFGRIPPIFVFITLFILLIFFGIRLIISIKNDVRIFKIIFSKQEVFIYQE